MAEVKEAVAELQHREDVGIQREFRIPIYSFALLFIYLVFSGDL